MFTNRAENSTSEEGYGRERKKSINVINLSKLLTPLGQWPVSKPKLLRVKSYTQQKATSVNETINRDIFIVGGATNEAQEMIMQNQQNEKYMILTCLPKRLSEYKIIYEFGVSPYVAHTVKVTQPNKDRPII
ncbi:hypothetical protein ANN_04404 [Periplaneta americana]|uniref:Uncharacterized protein n=1 Tax=Periplaneta americana TaxID=6978 RepID=A0ABQ8T8G2_PERAM|nr:hypothetical protein ANN_04404 [Periplaneta americana]